MSNHLQEIKKSLVAGKNIPPVDIHYLIFKVEQLKTENEGLMKLKEIAFKEAESFMDPDDFNALINNITIEINKEASKNK